MRHLIAPGLGLILALAAGPARASVSPPDSLRLISPDRLLSFSYANDLFFRTDYYFTQGLTFTLVHPVLARSPVHHLLPGGPGAQYHGITLRYDGFTPLRIQDAFIRVGDRPYATYLYASFFRVSSQPARRQRLTTALEIGFIGPAAGGKEVQTTIHRLTNNAPPRGWDYQIRNAPILGYRVAWEKLLAAPRHVELLSSAEASVGTLYTYAGAGLRLRAGRLNPYLGDLGVTGPAGRAGQPRWQLYGQATLDGRLIAYDATLQGGIFTTNNPYTLAATELRRAVLRSAGGVVLAHAGLSFAATAVWVSPEFTGGRTHRWGVLELKRTF